jgi:hypothetical protein
VLGSVGSCRVRDFYTQRVNDMAKSFYIEYQNTPFLQTSKTAAHCNRLNWRCEILLTRNREAIEGKRILDLASHDGRFSYACLKLGASHVTGVEGRQHLIEFAIENLTSLSCKPQHFSFIQDDAFAYLPKVKPKEFDTILCFGFFYHTVRQNELLREIKRIHPAYFMLDTYIARGVFIVRPPCFPVIDQGAYPKTSVSLLNRLNPIVKAGQLIRIPNTLRKLVESRASPDKGKPCLVFKTESHSIEAATIDPVDLVAWPTKTFIEVALKSYGFNFRQLHWSKKEIKNWTAIEDYRTGDRVSYVAQSLE